MAMNNDLNKDDLPWTFTERQQGEVNTHLLSKETKFILFNRVPNQPTVIINPLM